MDIYYLNITTAQVTSTYGLKVASVFNLIISIADLVSVNWRFVPVFATKSKFIKSCQLSSILPENLAQSILINFRDGLTATTVRL